MLNNTQSSREAEYMYKVSEYLDVLDFRMPTDATTHNPLQSANTTTALATPHSMASYAGSGRVFESPQFGGHWNPMVAPLPSSHQQYASQSRTNGVLSLVQYHLKPSSSSEVFRESCIKLPMQGNANHGDQEDLVSNSLYISSLWGVKPQEFEWGGDLFKTEYSFQPHGMLPGCPRYLLDPSYITSCNTSSQSTTQFSPHLCPARSGADDAQFRPPVVMPVPVYPQLFPPQQCMLAGIPASARVSVAAQSEFFLEARTEKEMVHWRSTVLETWLCLSLLVPLMADGLGFGTT